MILRQRKNLNQKEFLYHYSHLCSFKKPFMLMKDLMMDKINILNLNKREINRWQEQLP